MTYVAAVDPYHAGLDLSGDTVGLAQICGEDGGAQAICRVVGLFDGLLCRLVNGFNTSVDKGNLPSVSNCEIQTSGPKTSSL